MDVEAREVNERLALVERSMRRYRAALAAVTMIAAAGLAGPPLLGAAKAPGVIQARSFEAVDENGIVRASLSAGPEDSALNLYDKDGKMRAGLNAGGGAEALNLWDGEQMRVSLGTIGNYASMTLYDQSGQQRVAVGNDGLKRTADGSWIAQRPTSSIELLNERGGVLWEAPSPK